MRVWGVTLLVAGLLAGAQADDAKGEQEKLKGTWTLVAAERGGQKAEEDRIKDIKLTVAGDKITLKTPNGDNVSTFKLDPAKKPKAIDIIPTDGPNKGKPRPGIYELDGDTLKLCYNAEPDQDRPTEFATKPGARQMLMILKRDK
jgi:uncharacterized protein (TIGR03067 family)